MGYVILHHFCLCCTCAASQQLSLWIKVIKIDIDGKDNEFLSFISKIKKKSRHLVLWSLEDLGSARVWVREQVVQGKDVSPLVHPIYGKLLCCLL